MKTNIKHLVSALALGLAAVSPALRAQDTTPPAPPPPAPAAAQPAKHHAKSSAVLDQLTQKLSLTDEQKAKVSDIIKAQGKQMHALHNDESLSAEDRAAKVKEMRKSFHDQVRAVLTPDQQKTFDAMPPPSEHHGKKKPAADQAPAADAPPANN